MRRLRLNIMLSLLLRLMSFRAVTSVAPRPQGGIFRVGAYCHEQGTETSEMT